MTNKIVSLCLFITIVFTSQSCDDIRAESAINTEQNSSFMREDDKLHYFVYVMQNSDLPKMKKAKNALIDFHNTFFEEDKLRISNMYLNPEEKLQLLLVRSFDNRDKSLEYTSTSKANIKAFLNEEEFNYDMFPISQFNYREFVKQRSAKDYLAFYKMYYGSQ